jgi:Histone chaperone involved in gene silencing
MSFLDINLSSTPPAADPFESVAGDIVQSGLIEEPAETAFSASDDLAAGDAAEKPQEPGADPPSSDNPQETPVDEPEKPETDADTTDDEPEKVDDDAAIAEEDGEAAKSETETEDDADEPGFESAIPSKEQIFDTYKRSMSKPAMAEFQRVAEIARGIETELHETRNVIEEFGGTEVLAGYKPIHEFIAELPPSLESDNPEAWQNYYQRADSAWEALLNQNEKAAVTFAMQGAMSLVANVPESHGLMLSAILQNELARTEARGANSQADIDNYRISADRVADLIRLDALGFVPKDLSEYEDEFGVREAQAAAKAGEPAAEDKPESQTNSEEEPKEGADKAPTPQKNPAQDANTASWAQFEKEFEESLPTRIGSALQKAQLNENNDLAFVIANAAENLVRKQGSFRSIQDYLRGGNPYRTEDGKIDLPVKLHKQKVDNAATIQAELLVKRLLSGLKTSGVSRVASPPPTPVEEPEQKPVQETQQREAKTTGGGKKIYSSTEVEEGLRLLNGGI